MKWPQNHCRIRVYKILRRAALSHSDSDFLPLVMLWVLEQQHQPFSKDPTISHRATSPSAKWPPQQAVRSHEGKKSPIISMIVQSSKMLFQKQTLTSRSRIQADSTESTKQMIFTSSTRPSRSAEAQESPLDQGTNGLSSAALGTPLEDLCEASTQQHVNQRQEQDLLGLASETTNDASWRRSESDSPDEVLGAVPRDQMSACPIHSRILSGQEKRPVRGEQPVHMPMDRYLAEGLVERYALLSLDDGEQWARYFHCVCKEQSTALARYEGVPPHTAEVL